MLDVIDFFFSPYPTAQTRRLRAALNDGLAHGSQIVPRDPLPAQSVTLLFYSNPQMPIERVAVYYTTDGVEPWGECGIATRGIVVQAERIESETTEVEGQPAHAWKAALPAQADGTLVRYRADAWSISGDAHWYADRVDPVNMAPEYGRVFAYHVDTWQPPAWWHDAVVYQIFVDRFNAAHDEPPLLAHDEAPITGFFGGTLRGIIEKLDYLQSLGITCIWLSPIFESPTHHGYNASDYFTVATRYGTNDTLRQLIRAAHQRGMRVMLDFVANHTSHEHPAFLAAQHDLHSETRGWYAFSDSSPQNYRSYASIHNMPELLTDNPKVQRYLFDAALYWLNDFEVDALRLDYVPGPSYAFWTLFQQAIKTQVPQALTIGEITGPLEHVALYAGRMDAFMDFPLADLLRRVFALREQPLATLFQYLEERCVLLPDTMARATLLDNHDMHRFLWMAHGNSAQLTLAATCHFTLEGTPIVYYGTEIGLSQYKDAHKENAYARAPMLWDERQDSQLLAHYQQLIALRHAQPALRYGALAMLPVQLTSSEPAEQVAAYLRYLHEEYVLVILNNSQFPVQLRIPLATTFTKLGLPLPTQRLHSLLPFSADVQVQEGGITLELAALEGIVLRLR